MTADPTDHSLLQKILIRFPMTGKCVARTGHVCITHVHVHLLREMQVWLIENAQSKFRVLQRAAYCWFCSSCAEHKGFGLNKLKAERKPSLSWSVTVALLAKRPPCAAALCLFMSPSLLHERFLYLHDSWTCGKGSHCKCNSRHCRTLTNLRKFVSKVGLKRKQSLSQFASISLADVSWGFALTFKTEFQEEYH